MSLGKSPCHASGSTLCNTLLLVRFVSAVVDYKWLWTIFFSPALWGMWDLSSLTRVWTQTTAVKAPMPNHQTTRELLWIFLILSWLKPWMHNPGIQRADYMQGYLIVMCFTLLCFAEIASFTNWSFVATCLQWANLSAPFPNICSLCVSVTFWKFSQYVKLFFFIITFIMVICNPWSLMLLL